MYFFYFLLLLLPAVCQALLAPGDAMPAMHTLLSLVYLALVPALFQLPHALVSSRKMVSLRRRALTEGNAGVVS